MGSNATLSETMIELRKEGYTEDFNLKQNCLDQAILYAISSDHFNHTRF